jgi:hypothetical protein
MSDNMKNMGFGSLAPERKETILGYDPGIPSLSGTGKRHPGSLSKK